MSFAHPEPAEHEAAQEQVRAARDTLHTARERAEAGRAGPHEVATAQYKLHAALEHLASVQAGDAEAAS